MSTVGKAEVLAFAKRLYDWVVANLRDPADGCYWNDKQASGSIREVKWTYNTGAMISNGVRLYKITGEQTYLDSAIASSDGAYNYFVRPLNGLALAYPDHDPWFTTKLVRAFIDIEPYYKMQVIISKHSLTSWIMHTRMLVCQADCFMKIGLEQTRNGLNSC